MRILVTGGAGYIGSHCVDELLKARHEVTVVDNLTTGFSEAISPHVEFIKADVRDSESIKKILVKNKIESVIHFAAKLLVPESTMHPLDYYDNNVVGSLRLIQVVREVGIKNFIFSSSASVYAEGLTRPLLETDPIGPMSPYGWSKRMVEQILIYESKANSDFKFIALRYFNVAGAALDGKNGQRSVPGTHLVKVASEVAAGKRTGMSIFGTDWDTSDRTCVRDYIHIQDLAKAHSAAVNALQSGHSGGIFNCGYGHGYSVKEVIQMMEKVSGKTTNAKVAGRRAGDVAITVADVTKIKSELRWAPEFDSLELICRTAYEWEKSIT